MFSSALGLNANHVLTNSLVHDIKLKLDPKALTVEKCKECVVCMDAEATHAFTPCGHACVCSACANSTITHCPICRAEATGTLQVYTL